MKERAVCRGDDVLDNQVKILEIDGVEIGLIRVNGFVVAFENSCPHQGGPVCYGEVLQRIEVVLDHQKRVVEERLSREDVDLVCPWHGWEFDIMTGECIADRRIHLRRWKIVERDGLIYTLGRAPLPRPHGAGGPGHVE